ncbi:MAG: TldD/PmbA family protein [Thermoplasmata archaeon]
MADLRDFESDLKKMLTRLERKAVFSEVLGQRIVGDGVRINQRETTPSTRPRLHGAAIRAWSGSRWVESATSDFGPMGCVAAVEGIERGLQSDQSRGPPPGPSATGVQEMMTRPAHPVPDLGLEGMISLGRDVLGWATQVPGVQDAEIQLGWDDEERLYLNSVGARCYQRRTRVRAGVAPIAIENGNVQYDFLARGATGGREVFDFLSEAGVKTAAEDSLALLKAGTPPAGEMAVLLDPGVAGTFAHESFGHGTEADQFVRDRSYLKPVLGSMVGPEILTIVDNGALPTGWGSIYFDDEGNPGQRTALVEKGRFVGALHDRETAAILHARPTGNTRRSDFLSRPFVRMTNTYTEPGDWTLDELLAEMKDGILLEHATSGIEDPLGGQMQLKVKKGHRVEHGERSGLVSSMALSGKVLDFLKAIRGVSQASDFRIEPGFCGKGHTDYIPAGTGGTYLLSRAVVGPG